MKKGPRQPGGRELLSEEDRSLWRFATRSLQPLRGKARVHAAIEDGGSAAPHRAPLSHPQLKHTTRVVEGVIQSPPKPHPLLPRGEPAKRPPPLADLDRRLARRLRSGKVEIEARIDLHGLRQDEAHAALRSFLFSAHAKGLRSVLVITGKGVSTGRSAGQRISDFFGEPERGVLRRNVPHWLSEPDLRAIIVSYTGAAPQHGGEGAIYVQLRSRHRLSERD